MPKGLKFNENEMKRTIIDQDNREYHPIAFGMPSGWSFDEYGIYGFEFKEDIENIEVPKTILDKILVRAVFLLLTASLYSCNAGAPVLAISTTTLTSVPVTTSTPSPIPVATRTGTATPITMPSTTYVVVPSLEQSRPAFTNIQTTQPPIPAVPDLPARTIDGDWIIRDLQIIENEKLIINGQVRVLSNASLVLKNAVLEINYPSDSFNPWPWSGLTSLYVERGGTIEFTNSFLIAVQPRAMLAAQEPGRIVIRNSTFGNVQSSFIRAPHAVIEGNTFALPPDQGISAAIEFFSSSEIRISGNHIIGESSPNMFFNPASSGIALGSSDHNEVRDNTIFGTKNGVSLLASSNNQITGNTWTGPKSRQGEAGIGMERWSNNNVIENNTLENAGSAILFVLESKNNKVSNNTLRDAGLGIVLRWTSGNIINGNTLEYILEDGIRAYRSYGNFISNNQISHSGEGISLFTSWENQVGGNVIQAVDRGFYLFDARQNQILRNEVRESIQSVLAVQSAENVLAENNFIQSIMPAMEESTSFTKNTWQGNYWESAPYSIGDSRPAGQAWPVLNVPTPEFQPIEFGEVRYDVIQISDQTVWDGQTKTINGGITIERGGRLVIRNSSLTFAPEGMQREIWINVLPGGALEIEESEIYGPEKDHDLRIKVYPDAEIIMRNSELHNAGSWVGTFGAAIGYQGKSALIENNIFENVYCAFSSETPAANIQFINNTITNTIEGVTIIGDAPNTTIAFNQIRQSAIWGIQIWSLSPNIGSVVRENRVENSWGMGIFDAYANSFTIEPNNTFADLKGPGLVILEDSYLDGRQFRPLSLTATNVQAGDNVAVTFNLMPFFPETSGLGYTYTLSLTVNGMEIAHKEVNVQYGETLLVTLEGKATSAGVVKLAIRARPRITVNNTYKLTIAAGAGGRTNPVSGTYTYDEGTVVSISAAASAGCRFGSWSGDASGTSNPVNVTMDADMTVTANFLRQYHLIIAAGAGGTTDPAPGDYVKDSGSVVSITALPYINYRFLVWSGSVSGTSNPVNITMDADKTATSSFQRIIYPCSNAAGQQILNRSLSQAEYINVLTWSPNANNVNITGYKIYLVVGGQKTELATITGDKTSYTYQHRRVTKGQEYTYQIVAVNNEPREGDPATVVVR